MAGISALGIGSGLELSSLVDQLVAAQRAPVDNRLNTNQGKFNSQLSAFGLLRSSLASFQSAFSGLATQDNFFSQSVSSSDPNILTASASSNAAAINARIDVQAVAKSHSLASQTFSSIDATVDAGDITISFGTTDYDSGTDAYNSFTLNPLQATQTITVSAANSNNTLSGLRDHINDNDFGVKANIVNDGTGFRLLLSSDSTGLKNSLQVSVSDMGSNLASFAFNATATNMQQTVAAQDALFSIDGLAVSSDSNTITNAIDGLTINLQKASPGTEISLEVKKSTTAGKAAIEDFVDTYNNLLTTVRDLSGFNAVTETGGILIGDSSVRTIESSLRGLITSPISQLSGSVQALADLGITTQVTGKLSIDSSKLSAALSSDPAGVAAVFAPAGTPSDALVAFSGSTVDTQAGNYALTISQIATQGRLNAASVLPADFSVTPLVIDADNDSLVIKLDGITSDSILIPPGSYNNGDTLAAVIQSQINADAALKNDGVSALVSYDSINNRFDITSARYGSASKVELVNTDTNSAAQLGFAAGSGTDGVAVAGTINGQSATGSGQTLTSDVGASKGLAVNITGGAIGSRGSLVFSTGFIASLDAAISNMLEDDGLINAREDGLQTSLDDISAQREALELRMEPFEARLVAQFSAMDALVSSLQTTSNFLTSQLANLPGAFSRNSR